jgi:hypothetical protein
VKTRNAILIGVVLMIAMFIIANVFDSGDRCRDWQTRWAGVAATWDNVMAAEELRPPGCDWPE